ncbi:MAG: diacylglycerol kinase family protein [Gemmatimonadaceae bacterium]
MVNPVAGRGRNSPPIRELVNGLGSVAPDQILETRASGDEETLARAALAAGATTLLVVGGDGTCSKVARAIIESRKRCSLAVLPAGTGNDFAKTLGVSHLKIEDIVAVLRTSAQRIDIGVADGNVFLNSCGFGFDASVLEASNRVRYLTGGAVYVYSALRQLFTFRGFTVSEGRSGFSPTKKQLMVTVSNGRYLGGAFKIAPSASVLDGELDIAFFEDCNVIQRARVFAGALRGTHLGMKSVTSRRARSLSLKFDDPPAMEVDGELHRARSTTVTIECMPRGLSVIAGPGALL